MRLTVTDGTATLIRPDGFVAGDRIVIVGAQLDEAAIKKSGRQDMIQFMCICLLPVPLAACASPEVPVAGAYADRGR